MADERSIEEIRRGWQEAIAKGGHPQILPEPPEVLRLVIPEGGSLAIVYKRRLMAEEVAEIYDYLRRVLPGVDVAVFDEDVELRVVENGK